MRSSLVRAYRRFRRAKFIRFLGFHGVTAVAVLSHAEFAMTAVMAVLLASISVTDLLWKRIPNDFLLSGLVWTLGLTIAGHHSLSLTDALFGLVVGFGVKLALYFVFGGGEGDVKLFAVLGSIVGGHGAVEALLIGYPIAAAVAVFAIIGRYAFRVPHPFQFTLPMGPAFALATLLVGLPASEIDHANERTSPSRLHGD